MALPGNTSYQTVLSNYRARLAASPTANTQGVDPTPADVSLDRARLATQKQADTAEADANKRNYYPQNIAGAPSAADSAPPTRLQTFLHTIGAPLSAEAGLVEAALGKGTEKGLDNVVANVQEGGTYGDILRSYNIPNWISAPAGIGLDFLGDPLAWATAGTEAFVPRVAEGLVKGAAEGAAKEGAAGLFKGAAEGAGIAAKSGILHTGTSLGRLVPGLEKAAFPGEAEAASQEAARAAAVAEGRKPASIGMAAKAYQTWNRWDSEALKAYDLKMGRDTMGDILSGKKGWPITDAQKNAALDKTKQYFTGLDPKTGKLVSPLRQKLGQLFIGSGRNWVEESMVKDAADVSDYKSQFLSNPQKTIEEAGNLDTKVPDRGAIMDSIKRGEAPVPPKRILSEPPSLAENARDARVVSDDPNFATAKDWKTVSYNMVGERRNTLSDAEQLQESIKSLQTGLLSKNAEAQKIVEGLTDIQKQNLVDALASMKTDIAEVDTKVAETLSKDPKVAWFFNKYIGYQSWFKNAVVPWNIPGAYINRLISDPVVAYMSGLNSFTSDYRDILYKVMKFSFGKPQDALELLTEPAIRDTVANYGGTFRSVFGVDPRIILDFDRYKNDVVREVSQAAERTSTISYKGGVKEAVKAALDEGFTKATEAEALKTGKSVIGQTLKEGAEPTTLASEHMIGVARRMINTFEREGREGNQLSKLLHGYLTGASEQYGKMDQIPRLTNFLKLSTKGVTMGEIRTMAPIFNIKPEDVISVPGRTVVKLTPVKAMEIASRMDINYAAMPAIVKMMRMTPIIGAPFASFSYGVGQQVGRAALFNPAAFNKVNWIIRELSGDKSPLEKQALKTPYYSWMNTPSMMKTPILLQNNPVYLNLSKAVDYYSMSLLQDPNRDYGTRFGGKIAKFLDDLPFGKQPESQLINDYILMPFLIGNTGGPDQGQFGQPLYSANAGIPEKIGSAVASGAESVLPLAAGYSALIPGVAGAIPNSVLPHMPYKFEALANALKGRTPAGLQTQEDPTEKTAFTLSRQAGAPLYKLNITNQ